jgi:hypothetical protein
MRPRQLKKLTKWSTMEVVDHALRADALIPWYFLADDAGEWLRSPEVPYFALPLEEISKWLASGASWLRLSFH